MLSGRVLDVTDDAPIAFATVVVEHLESGTTVSGTLAGEDGRFIVQGLPPGCLRDSPLLCRLLPGADGCARQRAQPVLRPWRHPARSSGGFPGRDHRDGGDAPGAGGWHRHATVPARRGGPRSRPDRCSTAMRGPSGRHRRPGRQSPAAGQRPRGHPHRRQAVEPDRLRQSARDSDSVSAANVEAIEIIHNPSASFDAAGMAGIINIIYRQEQQLGLSAGRWPVIRLRPVHEAAPRSPDPARQLFPTTRRSFPA